MPNADSTPTLSASIEAWHVEARAFTDLCLTLEQHQWQAPTDLPGWDVRAVVSHLAHLESELAGLPQPPAVEVGEGGHVHGLMGQYTEGGVRARSAMSNAEVLAEFSEAVETRRDRLQASPPADGTQTADGFAALLGWNWATLLSNRVTDVFCHAQDLRRATNQPGGYGTPGARLTLDGFGRALGFVLSKRARAGRGQSVSIVLTDGDAVLGRSGYAAAIGQDGRGSSMPALPAEPTTTLTLSTEAFTVLCAGRGTPVEVQLSGDVALGQRVRDGLGLTP